MSIVRWYRAGEDAIPKLSTPQFQEHILRERNWILRDVKLGVDSNSIIIIRTCVSICLGT